MNRAVTAHLHHLPVDPLLIQLPFFFLFLLLFVLYAFAVWWSWRRKKNWPMRRFFFWTAGLTAAAAATTGPVADQAHTVFSAHMFSHLLLGMLAPLLLVIAAPMTLLLRSVPVNIARKVTRLLKSRPLIILSYPLTALFLNTGGLWLLYKTHLFTLMHESALVYAVIHFHVFAAGYLFTASILAIDPMPHKKSFLYRAIILIIAGSFHSMLAKLIYASPPGNVPASQAEKGAMLMYYGGSFIDLLLITLFCYQWYGAARPRKPEPGKMHNTV